MSLIIEPGSDRRHLDIAPHPAYGPCDAFGGEEQWCSECARISYERDDRLAAAERAKQSHDTVAKAAAELMQGYLNEITTLRAQLLAAQRDRDAARGEIVLSGTITQCREFKGGRWCDLTVAPDDGVMEIVITVKVPTVALGRRVEVRVAAQPEKEEG